MSRSDTSDEAMQELPLLFSQLQHSVSRLEQLFPGRRFALDGHLIGSLAEVIARYMYDIELLPNSNECHLETVGTVKLHTRAMGTAEVRRE